MTGIASVNKPSIWRFLSAALLIAAAATMLGWMQRRDKGLPYRDDFSRRSLDGWTSYGGNWQAANGTVTNGSNESGSRLLTGREDLTDYRIESDVRLTNSYGDAGVVFRVTESEVGTNAFYGYYAGMRLPDMLVLARMDYGFQPLRIVKLPQTVHPGTWYHLTVEARGCHLFVQARVAGGQVLATTDTTDSAECQTHGNFGLRSFAAGGSWRNVDVQPIR